MTRVASSSSQTTNKSVGALGNSIPLSATQVGAEDPFGILKPLLVDASGALIVNTTGDTASATTLLQYNEVASVPVGVETSISSFTAPSGKTSYLVGVSASGQNIGQFNIYLNGGLIDKQYLYYMNFNLKFDYSTLVPTSPGLMIPVGQVLLIRAINSGSSSVLYNASMIILEVN